MRLRSLVLVLLFILPGCMGGSGEESEQSNIDTISLEVWYTFTVDSMEEEVFLEAVNDFSLETGIDVKVTNKPYDDSDQQFQIAAQGGEAPDLLRVSSDSLGKFGETRVDGYPLFEDQDLGYPYHGSMVQRATN